MRMDNTQQVLLKKKKPSLVNVAELAKVSPVTVARTFTGNGYVAEKTKQVVVAAAKE